MTTPYIQLEEAGQTREIPLGAEPVMIGRRSDCAIVLGDNLASRNHCVIERSANGYNVRDLGSRNGTALNGRLLDSTVLLRTGDVIQVGQARLTFVDPSQVPAVEELSEDDLADVVEVDDRPPAATRVKPAKAPAGNPSAGWSDDNDLISPVFSESDSFSTEAAKPKGIQVDESMLGNPEEALEALADSLTDKSVEEHQIVLVNARGQVLHSAKKSGKQKGPREPVDLFRLLLLCCIRSHATDIHLEPRQESHNVRLRVDGLMVDVARLGPAFGTRVAALVKVLSDIDIAQRNALQEGHFSSQVPSRRHNSWHRVDYRVSFAPSVYGQKLVIRILDEENAPVLLKDLELPKWMERDLADQIEQDSGMVLVSGPTGSGKTTTLYSLLRSIDLHQRNAVTIEDPVEMQIENTTQMPVDEPSGKTFGNILRSVLRQDPDVIMIGEIRDAETARIAMQAAITGHMVLSTIHTRDTLGTVFRLLDLGIENYLISQGLNIVIAQRLVRQLCPRCRRKVNPNDHQRQVLNRVLGKEINAIAEPVGCPACLGTGYAGRRGVFEMLTASDNLRHLMQKPNLTLRELKEAVKESDFTTLTQSGYLLVAQGVATFDEVEKLADRERRAKGADIE